MQEYNKTAGGKTKDKWQKKCLELKDIRKSFSKDEVVLKESVSLSTRGSLLHFWVPRDVERRQLCVS